MGTKSHCQVMGMTGVSCCGPGDKAESPCPLSASRCALLAPVGGFSFRALPSPHGRWVFFQQAGDAGHMWAGGIWRLAHIRCLVKGDESCITGIICHLRSAHCLI